MKNDPNDPQKAGPVPQPIERCCVRENHGCIQYLIDHLRHFVAESINEMMEEHRSNIALLTADFNRELNRARNEAIGAPRAPPLEGNHGNDENDAGILRVNDRSGNRG